MSIIDKSPFILSSGSFFKRPYLKFDFPFNKKWEQECTYSTGSKVIREWNLSGKNALTRLVYIQGISQIGANASLQSYCGRIIRERKERYKGITFKSIESKNGKIYDIYRNNCDGFNHCVLFLIGFLPNYYSLEYISQKEIPPEDKLSVIQIFNKTKIVTPT